MKKIRKIYNKKVLISIVRFFDKYILSYATIFFSINALNYYINKNNSLQDHQR